MNGFTFQQPWMLVVLALLPAITLLFRRARRKRAESMRAFGSAQPPETILHARLRQRDEWAVMLALALLAFALARPGVNPRPRVNPAGGRDVVFVLDVSRSMLADDVRPSRLERAKEDVSRCIATLPDDRAGLVVFAGMAAIRCPLTHEHGFLRQMLRDASPDSVTYGSTYLQSALEKTTEKMLSEDRKGLADIILLTDGGDQGSHPEQTLAGLNDAAARLLVVGYGDPKVGARIPATGDPADGFVMDGGREVWATLEEDSLRSLAGAAAAGRFVRGGTPGFDLGHIYQQWSANAPRRYLNSMGAIEYDECYAWLLAPALLLLLQPIAGLQGRALPALMMLLSTGTGTIRADDASTSSRRAFESGLDLMKNGVPEEAAAAFQKAAATAGSPEFLAFCRFNEALADAAIAGKSANPGPALAALDSAVTAMREACMLRPAWPAASQALEVLYARHTATLKALKEQLEQLEQLNQQADALREELMRLLEKQRKLLGEGTHIRRNRETLDAQKAESLKQLRPRQQELATDTKAVSGKMEGLSKAMAELTSMAAQSGDPAPPAAEVETGFEEPLRHLAVAHTAQTTAASLLGPLDQVGPAIAAKQQAADALAAALEAMAAGQPDEGDPSMDDSEDMEVDETGEQDGAESQSMPMTGDFLSDPANRELPKPNFSPEDILREEQENAETRTKNKPARVGEGEKDW